MKKIISLVSLAFLLISVNSAYADEGYLSKLNGYSWQASTPQERQAFIVGMDGVVALEQAIDQKHKEKALMDKTSKQKNQISTLSTFERAWTSVFENTPRTDIVKQINDYYAKNPNQLDRNVFEVIWYELLQPKYKGV